MGNSKKRNRIQRICGIDEEQEKELYEKGRLLLEIYRSVCWHAWDDAIFIKESTEDNLNSLGYASDDMDRALIYLETFVPEEGRMMFEEKVRDLFETSWLIDIVEAAMVKVMDFPGYGEQYYSILEKYYLDKTVRSEADMLELLHVERATFYRRKKEAITVFGYVIWGMSIWNLRSYCKAKAKRAEAEPENM